MLKLKLKSFYNNKAPVHEKYVMKALSQDEGLELEYKGDKMTIPHDEINKRITFYSRPMPDKYKNTVYRLAYFNWVPDNAKKVVEKPVDNPQLKLL